MNKYCDFAGIGLIPWGTLNGGQLARSLASVTTTRGETWKDMHKWGASSGEDEIVRRVDKLASDKGWAMAQVALAWIGGKVTSPIVGVGSVSQYLLWSGVTLLKLKEQVERLEEAIIPGYKLTDDEVKFLEEPCVFFALHHLIKPLTDDFFLDCVVCRYQPMNIKFFQ